MRRNGALKLSIPYNTYWFEMWQLGRPKERLKMQPPSAWSWWLASSTLTTSPTYAAARSLVSGKLLLLCQASVQSCLLQGNLKQALDWCDLLLATARSLARYLLLLAPPGVLYITMMCHYWFPTQLFGSFFSLKPTTQCHNRRSWSLVQYQCNY